MPDPPTDGIIVQVRRPDADQLRTLPLRARTAIIQFITRCPVSAGYSVLLAAGGFVLSTRSPAQRSALLLWASTNIQNLEHRPIEVLVCSAFLPEEHPELWVALALFGLGLAEWVLGPVRMATLAISGHLGGTAVSEGLLWYRIHLGDVPPSARQIVDVGPSFVVVTGMTAAVVAGATTARIAALAGLAALTPALLDGLTDFDVAAVGHTAAVIIGAAGGWAMLRHRRRVDQPPPRELQRT